MYNPTTEKSYDYKGVRHYSYSIALNGINPLVNDWKLFIDHLLQAKLIINSSLHGIILAESYGTAAILLKESNMNMFKYNDYCFSTQRDSFPIATSIENALYLDPPLPNIKMLQETLIETFPTDLWGD